MSKNTPAIDPADLPEIPDTEVMDVAIERYTEFLVASNERAVPDIRDGLKPVHRRILLALRDAGASATSRHYKSAQIVGACFARGSMVETPAGLRAIETLRAGDEVTTPDGDVTRVTVAYHNPPGAMVRVTFGDGNALDVTPDQRFRVREADGSFGWCEAELLFGRRVLTSGPTGPSGEVGCVAVHPMPDAENFDIEVEAADHAFIVEGLVVHNCLGKYHPHGDTSVYDASVKMAQDFALRYPLVDGQGNFGSIDGDGAAAYRYCVTGDTLVATTRGIVRIDEIVPGAAPNSDHEVALEVFDGRGRTVHASRLFHSGTHPVYRVRTSVGLEITGTANHPLLARTPDGTGWKTIGEIAAGDELAIALPAGALPDAPFEFARVAAVTSAGEAPVYSLRVDTDEHAFVANGLVNHNTEMRITAAGDEMLRDLENRAAGIVPWGGNFTNEYDEPHVIPSHFPQLLCNGILTGIGTGYSSMWLPHNLREVVDAVIAVIDDPAIDAASLVRWIKGPDFPTGGMLMGTEGYMAALVSGKGSVTVRAKMAIEEAGRDTILVVTEIPWQKEKTALIEQISLAGSKDKNGKAQVEGILEVADESGNDWRTDMRIAIRLRKEANPQVVANALYRYTALQTNFSYNMMAYVDGYPTQVNFREAIGHYIDFQFGVLTARTTWRRKRALEALEVQEAYLLADKHSNALVPLARSAANRADLESKIPTLISEATPRQCEVIAGMPLYRFSKIDTDGVRAKITELRAEIAEYDRLLGSRDAMYGLLKDELRDVKSRFGDDRRTEINAKDSGQIKTLEELITDEPCYLAVSSTGLISRLPTSTFRAQKRGGAGVSATRSEDESIVALLAARTRERIWMLTDRGNLYTTRVAEIEETARGGRGMSPKRLASVGDDERVVRLVTPPADGSGELVIATALGKVIRSRVADYANLNAAGLKAINVLPGDRIIGAAIGAEGRHLLFVTSDGYAVRCEIGDVSVQGRGSQGVTSVNLGAGAEVVSLDVIAPDDERDVLTIASSGKGKRSKLAEYPTKSRATKGVTATDLATAGKGKPARVAFNAVVAEGEDLLVASRAGKVLVTETAEIRRAGRATAGVMIMTPGDGDEIATGAIIRPAPPAEAKG